MNASFTSCAAPSSTGGSGFGEGEPAAPRLRGLNENLGSTPQDLRENIRRVGEVAGLVFHEGSVVICSFEVAHTTGITSPDEPPERPEIRVETVERAVGEIVDGILGG